MIAVKHRHLPLLFTSCWLAACQPAAEPDRSPTSAPQAVAGAAPQPAALATVQVQNPSSFARPDQLISLALSDLGLKERPVASSLWSGGTELPTQWLDTDLDGQADQLLVLSQLAAAEHQQWQLTPQSSGLSPTSRVQAEISIKEGGEWQGKVYKGGQFVNVQQVTPPAHYTDHSEYIRYEGPGIESDKVGYRIYLDWRNGFDIFGNSTGKPVLHQVGLDGYSSYHEMQPWGMDLLKVGKSLGAGGFGYWDGKQALGVAKVSGHTATVLDNGPLLARQRIQYHNWQIAGKTVNVDSKLSITAGSRLLRNQLSLSEPLDNLVIGLVKLPDTKVLTGTLESSGHQYTYLATYGAQSLNKDKLGMALLFKQGQLDQLTEDDHSHLAVMKLIAGKQLDYYLLAAWQGEPGGIQNEQQFVDYLQQQVELLTRPPRIQLENPATTAAVQQPLTAQRALFWAKAMADAEMQRQVPDYVWGGWDHERQRPTTFEYTTGLLLQAIDDLNQLQPDPAYQQAVLNTASSFVAEDGTIHSYELEKFNIDSLNSGNLLLRVWQRTGEERYQKALALLREQVRQHPRTENGAFWHKKIYPYQVWLDGVYMGMPFLTRYSSAFEQGASYKEAVHEFEVVAEKLRSPDTGLYFHGWDESKQQRWANQDTGLSPEYWSRGMGWLAMALVDVLEEIPAQHTELRAPLIAQSQQLAAVLQHYADPERHVWYQIPDKAGATGNYLESSASSMFVYFYAKALNLGIIDPAYRSFTVQSYQGLLNEFVLLDAKGQAHLTNMVQVAGLSAGRDGSYDYYMNEPVIRNDAKGMGPFIMASVQLAKLLGQPK
ncbi:glycoside hydrolase family 88 protein [Rheinheimera sp.]|uniref:glycoside hydrolase family 88 protein n=1 Tax=Rheinheimera sp. TaxID=1869214 RepID=UPI00307DAD80